MIWLQTYTGKAFDLLNPTPEMVDIEDIAHALSLLCCFTGHTKEFYSVAQHSVLCASRAPHKYAMHALLHDAHEAYVGDMNSPLKRLLGKSYYSISYGIQKVIDESFGIEREAKSRQVIKNIDLRMLKTEARDLLGPAPRAWCVLEKPYSKSIGPWLPSYAESTFMSAFRCIIAGRI